MTKEELEAAVREFEDMEAQKEDHAPDLGVSPILPDKKSS